MNETATATGAEIITREDYMTTPDELTGEAREAYRWAAHRAYFAQFVTPAIRERVERGIPARRIAASKDAHFNDIPLGFWDRLATPCPADVNAKMREAGDYPTLSMMVCTLKECARQLKEVEEW